MSKLSLNLLSPTERMESSLQWHYVIIKNVIFMILSVTFVIAVMLFGAKLILLNRLTEAEMQISLVNASLAGTNQKIANVNKDLRDIEKIQKEFVPWSESLWNVLTLVPNEIQVSSLRLSSDESTIYIDGIAQTRESLLEFQESLETAQFAENVYLPLASLLQKTDITFNVTITVAPVLVSDLQEHETEGIE
ncbi:MAG: PilN domain-containing protein [Patescibacteria group bacterium]